MDNNTNGKNDGFSQDAHIIKPGPWMYNTVGTVLICVWIIGFFINLMIIFSFATNKKLRTTDTCLIVGLTFSDIGQAIFGIPLVIVSSFQKEWIFGMIMCQFYAFLTITLGIAQITTLTSIATERYYIIVHYKRKLSTSTGRCAIVILFSFLHGLFWGSGPLFGWSGYMLEETELACCVSWKEKTLVDISYTISLCTLGWFIPMVIIIHAYLRIACTIYKEQAKLQYLRHGNSNTNSRNRERKVTVTAFIMIVAFVISWLPYSVIYLWSTLGEFNSIPMLLQVAPAIFAKSSIIWNPIIYVARHRKFRKGVLNSIPFSGILGNCTRTANLARKESEESSNMKVQLHKKSDLKQIGSVVYSSESHHGISSCITPLNEYNTSTSLSQRELTLGEDTFSNEGNDADKIELNNLGDNGISTKKQELCFHASIDNTNTPCIYNYLMLASKETDIY